MTTRTMVIGAALFGLLVAAPAGSAWGAPMAYLSIQARVAGSTSAFSNVVAVRSGQALEYRLFVRMAPVGTVNSYSVGTKVSARTITSLSTSDGANTSRFNIYQASSENIVVDFATSSTLNPNYDGGGTASGGTVTTRSGGGHDLLSVIAIGNTVGSNVYRAGVAGVNTPGDTMIASGTAALSGAWSTGVDSTVSGSYLLPTSVPSTSIIMKGNFNSGTAFTYTPANIKIESPWGFNNLTLYVPWATSEADGDYTVPQNLSLSLTGSGTYSSHTTGSFLWEFFTGSMWKTLLDTMSGTLTWQQLQDLGMTPRQAPYPVRLTVSTGDGETAVDSTTVRILPEPATVVFLGIGGVLALVWRRRRT